MNNSIHTHGKDFSLYISYNEITTRIAYMSQKIAKDVKALNPLFIGVLNGSFMFASDLLRQFDFDCQVSFIKVSSYSGTASSGEIKKVIGLNENIEGRHVIIIEDIIDSGLTVHHLLSELNAMNPATIRVAALLHKPGSLKVNIQPDYVGFEVPDKFLVGYGLDYDGYGRNLPDIYSEINE